MVDWERLEEEQRNERIQERLRDRIERLETALSEIAKGEGPFSMDPLEHAANTIKNMMTIARKALKEDT